MKLYLIIHTTNEISMKKKRCTNIVNTNLINFTHQPAYHQDFFLSTALHTVPNTYANTKKST